jgi:hypothetical protein
MALIDKLPKFRHKPLDLEPTPTRLVAKPIEKIPVVTKPSATAVVTPGAVIAPTLAPIPTQTLAPTTTSTKVRLVLPDAYKAFTPLAEAVSDSTIVNPKARAAVIAQMALEKGWKTPVDHNYGNITAGQSWKGPIVNRGDTDAQGKKITQNFRQYANPGEFMNDYLSLLKNNYPAAYAELHSDNFDIDRFTAGLVGGEKKYATNPKYQEEVKRVYTDVDSRINK